MLDLIDLDIPELGYSRFISAWLYQGSAGTFLVDVGPACTVDVLCQALAARGVKRLDWILLTHIHMDHAGAVGHVADRFPEARIFCHEKAVSHLVDPGRLWAGSLKALGRVAEVYGEMQPVAENRILTGGKIDFGDGIRVLDTPGHAAHHLCFVFGDLFFGGELFGIYQALDGDFYLRPATPPRFVAEAFFESMAHAAPYLNRRLCFAHYGSYPDGREILGLAREQLKLWVDVIGAHLETPDMEAIISDLAEHDTRFGRLRQLPPRIYERERFFIQNSIKGIHDYLSPG